MPIEEAKNTMLGVLLEEEYGVLPNRETSLSWETVSEEKDFAAGKAILRTVNITAQFETGAFTFPVRAAIKWQKKGAVFCAHQLPARRRTDNEPTEEIIEQRLCRFIVLL